MSRTFLSPLILLTLLAACTDTPEPPAPPPSASAFVRKAFSDVVWSAPKDHDKARSLTVEMEKRVFSPAAGDWVDDETVLTVEKAWRVLEGVVPNKPYGPDPPVFVATENYLRQALAHFAGREPLTAILHLRLADLLALEQRPQEALAHYQTGIAACSLARLELDRQRVHAAVALGDLYLAQGDKPTADAAYLSAYAYHWWNQDLPTTDDLLYFQRLYARAARGLILCRRYDAKRLREILIVPALGRELQPMLDQALREAQAPPATQLR